MKRHNDQPISKVLKDALNQPRLQDNRAEYLLRTRWAQEMGSFIASVTDTIQTKGRKVTLKLHSSSLRHEFLQNQEALLDRINQIVEMEDHFQEITIL